MSPLLVAVLMNKADVILVASTEEEEEFPLSDLIPFGIKPIKDFDDTRVFTRETFGDCGHFPKGQGDAFPDFMNKMRPGLKPGCV